MSTKKRSLKDERLKKQKNSMPKNKKMELNEEEMKNIVAGATEKLESSVKDGCGTGIAHSCEELDLHHR
jgi:hypothetical protein